MSRKHKDEEMYKWAISGYGELIRKILEFSGMKRSELAEKVGVSTTTIGRWINGTNVPSLAKWSVVKEVLCIEEEEEDPSLELPKEAYTNTVEQIGENEYIASWFCPNCNEEVEWDGEDEETWCKNCGQRITWKDNMEY